MLWFDQVFTAVILALTIFAPLALGATHAWAFIPLEAAIFALFGAVVLKPCPAGADLATQLAASDLRPILIPMALFVTLTAIEIIPMPPSLERWIAPPTYRLYQTVMPNWPRQAPYASLPAQPPKPRFVLLPSASQVQGGAQVPFRPRSDAPPVAAAKADFDAGPAILLRRVLGHPTWRTLSVSPAVTQGGFLEVAALAGLFVLVLAFPFEPGGEQRFARAIVKGVMLTAAAISLVGIYGSVSNNRLIVALFTPYDWRGAPEWGSRSTGTFANPDHFAAYLSFALPACVAGVMHPGAFASPTARAAYRLLAAVAAIAVVAALVVTQSRGGWTDAILGLATLAVILQSWQRRARHGDRAGSEAWMWGVVGALILIAFILLGSRGAYQFDSRLQETVTQESLWARMAPARQSLKMIADFPLFGVGLGCWPQLYRHYAPPPWTGTFFNATHNDYVQLGAETGLLGLGLMLLALVAVIRRLYSGFKRMPPASGPLFAALVAPLTGLAVHEFFDFPLQIPANALIFTLFLAIAARMARGAGPSGASLAGQRLLPTRPWTWLPLGVAAGLLVATLTQSTGAPYPFSIAQAVSPALALAAVSAYPADSGAHLNFVARLSDRIDLDDEQRELKIALFLDPTNPYARDQYAGNLLKQGQVAQALGEIQKSAFLSPMLWSHSYANGELLPLLPGAVQGAIAAGLREAAARRWGGVANELGGFYEELSQPAKAADAFVMAANEQSDPVIRGVYLNRAGSDYLHAGLSTKGVATLREAIHEDPTNPQPYRNLLGGFYGPRKDLAGARQLVSDGIEAGADPFSLYQGLADAAQVAGDNQAAETALTKALEYQPGDIDVMAWLGSIYQNDGKFDRAAYWMRKVARAQPRSAEAFYALAQAEDQNYDYSAADKAYSEAVSLAPSNAAYQQGYSAFKRKAAAASNAHPAAQ